MSETEEAHKGSRRHTGVLIGVMLLLPVLYTLSMGPAVRLRTYRCLKPETFQVVYAPVIGVARSFPAIGDPLNEYLWLWYPYPGTSADQLPDEEYE
jgi:hypothetical protein